VGFIDIYHVGIERRRWIGACRLRMASPRSEKPHAALAAPRALLDVQACSLADRSILYPRLCAGCYLLRCCAAPPALGRRRSDHSGGMTAPRDKRHSGHFGMMDLHAMECSRALGSCWRAVTVQQVADIMQRASGLGGIDCMASLGGLDHWAPSIALYLRLSDG